jgi:hypothetical protein
LAQPRRFAAGSGFSLQSFLRHAQKRISASIQEAWASSNPKGCDQPLAPQGVAVTGNDFLKTNLLIK